MPQASNQTRDTDRKLFQPLDKHANSLLALAQGAVQDRGGGMRRLAACDRCCARPAAAARTVGPLRLQAFARAGFLLS